MHTGTQSFELHNPWVFWVVMAMLLTVAITRIYYGHLLADRINAYIAGRYLKQMIRRELALYHPYSIITLLLFSTATGLIALKINEVFVLHILPQFNGWQFFLLASAATLLWIVGRALILKWIQVILGFDFGQTENRYRVVVFNQVCAYVLVPIVSVIYFVQPPLDYWLLVIGIVILGLNYLYRIVQSLITSVNYSVNLLYLFLYLCTLEIAPLIIVLSIIIY